MPGVEAALTAAGKSIAERALREWLATRAAHKERDADLKDLIQSGFRDRLAPRKFDNQLQGMALAVEGRLTRLIEQEFGGLDESARAAVLLEVVDALKRADLSDAALFEADADPGKLAERIVTAMPEPRLGAVEDRLYAILLTECVACLTGMMRQLPQYLPRAAAESLSRLSGLAEGMERLLARMPLRTLEAPEGRQDDAAFEHHYLDFISRTLDEVELFGVRVENYRPRTSLSVAYISLSVSAGDRTRTGSPETGGRIRRRGLERLSIASLTGRPTAEPSTERIEAALGRSRLMLLRGDAGSGKSTLLRWLAVTAARGDFTGAMSAWNGCVPMMIKLRSHSSGRFPAPAAFLDDVAQEVAGRMPRGWVERVLESGRGLLLVDGVDELLVRHRPAVREWLSRLLAAYPSMRVVVTSRPTAADARWLADEGFAAATLEPMTPEDLRELVRQWHVAMRDCRSLPCAPDELEGYETALLARMESNPHLGVVASTPLLAAMLCALNLDRRTQLPRNRMGFYEAVLGLLLERRDAERRITDEVSLDPDQKVWILRSLAWRLVSMGRSELSKATALKIIAEKLAHMTRMPYSADDVLEHLLRRSGVLREPVPGRIDFAHRTVQEYLAAGQLVEDEDVEAAVERAHLDQWREVVIMAAGHATGRLRRELLGGLLDRADEGGSHARRLRLLVAGCMETIHELPVDLRDRIEVCLAKVIPPRNGEEARVLAAAGEEILRRLPDDVSRLTERQAAMTVRTAWLINGPEALEKLAGYASDARWNVLKELEEGWRYYDADAYAKRVLADVPIPIAVRDRRLLRGVTHLSETRDVIIDVGGDLTDLRFVRAMPQLYSLELHDVAASSLDGVAALPELLRLWIRLNEPRPIDIAAVETLPLLRSLTLWNVVLDDLAFLDRIPRLEFLGLHLPSNDHADWVRPLARQSELQALAVDGGALPIPPAIFANVRSLTWASLRSDAPVADCLRTLAYSSPALSEISLAGPSPLDLAELGTLRPTRLTLRGLAVDDLSPLRDQERLNWLTLTNTKLVTDLSPLTHLRDLRHLFLKGLPDGIDIGPLARMHGLTVTLGTGQRVANGHLLRGTVRIKRL